MLRLPAAPGALSAIQAPRKGGEVCRVTSKTLGTVTVGAARLLPRLAEKF